MGPLARPSVRPGSRTCHAEASGDARMGLQSHPGPCPPGMAARGMGAGSTRRGSGVSPHVAPASRATWDSLAMPWGGRDEEGLPVLAGTPWRCAGEGDDGTGLSVPPGTPWRCPREREEEVL
ncbi:hypothetical protein NDU88_000375 [Pleurodeles waltl]|uniref:Uncharacterized protein n=1 Tax=Pleurodeles waltl TaxID=8319 RepID=A0AAV7MGN3_PLEWA|nr:hypothetical protein NDU88_000375 [Pleurodeles waltl]